MIDTAPGCRVLVVDDDALVLAGTAAMVEDLGHSTVKMSSGVAALEFLNSGTEVDLLITDHAMPGMTGAELARQVRRSWPMLPVLVASGYAELPDEQSSDLPRLSKPYRQDELAAQIAKLLDTRMVPNALADD